MCFHCLLHQGNPDTVEEIRNVVLVSRREVHLYDLPYDQLCAFVDELNDHVATMRIPDNYVITIVKNVVACCGILPLGAIIDVEGKDEVVIRDLDIQLYAKMIELCERDNIDVHETGALEVL